MVTLNIIPNELKKEIKIKNFCSIFKTALLIVVFLSIIYAIIFSLFALALQVRYTDLIVESDLTIRNTGTYAAKIKSINNLMNFTDKILNEKIDVYKLISAIGLEAPADIKFRQIKFDKNTKILSISGFAGNRDDLIVFKDNLDKKTYLTDIDFPLKNILEKYNINFDISAKIKSYELE